MAALYLHTFYILFSHSLSLPSQNESLLLLWGQKQLFNTRPTLLKAKLRCGASEHLSAGTSCQQQKRRQHRHRSTPETFPPSPRSLGFFTLHADPPRELNARALANKRWWNTMSKESKGRL